MAFLILKEASILLRNLDGGFAVRIFLRTHTRSVLYRYGKIGPTPVQDDC